jgi:hypothetical protein
MEGRTYLGPGKGEVSIGDEWRATTANRAFVALRRVSRDVRELVWGVGKAWLWR